MTLGRGMESGGEQSLGRRRPARGLGSVKNVGDIEETVFQGGEFPHQRKRFKIIFYFSSFISFIFYLEQKFDKLCNKFFSF